MVPKSTKDAMTIYDIIRKFRGYALPGKDGDNWLTIPEYFRLSTVRYVDKGGGNESIANPEQGDSKGILSQVMQFPTKMVCTGVSVNMPDFTSLRSAMSNQRFFDFGALKYSLKLDFKESLGNISYHFPCHSRVQNIGKKTVEALSLVPETNVSVVERCSGHAGTFGVKKEFHKMSMKIGKPVFKSMSSGKKDYITSDCQLAGHHINQGIEMLGLEKFDMLHPISLLRKAYSI